MFLGCCGTRFAQTSSHLIQKTSTILLIFLWRTNEQPYDFYEKVGLSIFEVNLEDLMHSLQNIQASLIFLARFYYLWGKPRRFNALTAKYSSKLDIILLVFIIFAGAKEKSGEIWLLATTIKNAKSRRRVQKQWGTFVTAVYKKLSIPTLPATYQ